MNGFEIGNVVAKKYLKMIGFFLLLNCGLSQLAWADNIDPWERANRKSFAFNDCLDRHFLKPVAKVYAIIVPGPIATSITNFFSNLDAIPTVANDLLQGNLSWAMADTGRFLINSTFGIAGLHDVAAKNGLPPHSTDFGITLQRWGVKNAPYIVLPIYGPSTWSDGLALIPDYYLTIYPYVRPDGLSWGIFGLYRRDAYLQRRAAMVEESKQHFVPERP
jgi:phospholipid-binding lipoprotein MlaA